jgi:hypothetical protein
MILTLPHTLNPSKTLHDLAGVKKSGTPQPWDALPSSLTLLPKEKRDRTLISSPQAEVKREGDDRNPYLYSAMSPRSEIRLIRHSSEKRVKSKN